MDLIGGALPNVIFIVGIIALGIGLGIEFKIIEIKAELTQQGRIVALTIGLLLIGVSLFLYTRPMQTAAIPGVLAQPLVPNQVATAAPTASQAIAPAVATALPTAMPQAPSATPLPITLTAGDPEAEFRALVASAMADGRLDKKDGSELIKKLTEAQKELDKGKTKEAEEKLRELQEKIEEAASEGEMDGVFAQEASILVDRIIESYGL